ncbi:hypothetical protein JG687_00006220, partial [Phytophthora cactorum]
NTFIRSHQNLPHRSRRAGRTSLVDATQFESLRFQSRLPGRDGTIDSTQDESPCRSVHSCPSTAQPFPSSSVIQQKLNEQLAGHVAEQARFSREMCASRGVSPPKDVPRQRNGR